MDNGFRTHWDNMACAPCLVQKNGPLIISYDNEKSLKMKINFALKKKLAGVMIWEITGDVVNGTNALLPGVYKAVYR